MAQQQQQVNRVKVKAVKAFPLGGNVVRPGDEVEVPAEKVANLVDRGFVESTGQAAESNASGDGARLDAALARLGGGLSVERRRGEGAAEYAERVADAVKSRPGSAADVLPEGFPFRDKLRAGGVTRLSQLVAMSDEQLTRVPGIGPEQVKEIRAAAKVPGAK